MGGGREGRGGEGVAARLLLPSKNWIFFLYIYFVPVAATDAQRCWPEVSVYSHSWGGSKVKSRSMCVEVRQSRFQGTIFLTIKG